MKGITHKQAQRYIRANLDGLLTESQRLDLQTHLASCPACRADSESFAALTSRLQTEFHSRWEAKDGPSKHVMAKVHSQSRRIIMSNRINFGLRVLAGIAALIVLVMTMNYVFLNTQYQAASSVTETPASSNPLGTIPIATPSAIPSLKPTAQYTLPPITLQTPSVPGDEPRLVFFISEPGKFEAWVPVAGDIVEYTITQTLFGKSVECSSISLGLNSASVTIRYCDLDSEETVLHSDSAILEEVRGAVEKEFRLRVDPGQVEFMDDPYPTLSLSGNEDMTSAGANDGTFKARIILAGDRVYFVHMSVYYIDWCYCRHQMDQVVDTFFVEPYMSIPFEPTPIP